jgi:hypothetical protein
MSLKPEQPDARHWHTFVDAEERDWWIRHHAQAWSESLTHDEDQAVHAYKGPFHRVVNRVLRGDTQDLSPADVLQAQAYIPLLDSAIYRGEINTDVILYRGFGSHSRHLHMEVGKRFMLDSYLSLSADVSWAQRFLRIKGYTIQQFLAEERVPCGTPAGFFVAQLEVLLERGTMLQVLSIQPPLRPGGAQRLLPGQKPPVPSIPKAPRPPRTPRPVDTKPNSSRRRANPERDTRLGG